MSGVDEPPVSAAQHVSWFEVRQAVTATANRRQAKITSVTFKFILGKYGWSKLTGQGGASTKPAFPVEPEAQRYTAPKGKRADQPKPPCRGSQKPPGPVFTRFRVGEGLAMGH